MINQNEISYDILLLHNRQKDFLRKKSFLRKNRKNDVKYRLSFTFFAGMAFVQRTSAPVSVHAAPVFPSHNTNTRACFSSRNTSAPCFSSNETDAKTKNCGKHHAYRSFLFVYRQCCRVFLSDLTPIISYKSKLDLLIKAISAVAYADSMPGV